MMATKNTAKTLDAMTLSEVFGIVVKNVTDTEEFIRQTQHNKSKLFEKFKAACLNWLNGNMSDLDAFGKLTHESDNSDNASKQVIKKLLSCGFTSVFAWDKKNARYTRSSQFNKLNLTIAEQVKIVESWENPFSKKEEEKREKTEIEKNSEYLQAIDKTVNRILKGNSRYYSVKTLEALQMALSTMRKELEDARLQNLNAGN